MDDKQHDDALHAYEAGAALVDRSHWGLIRMTGSTRHAFLHNQTTADFQNAPPGQIVSAVFLTAKARVVDWVRALIDEDAIWLITSPERHEVLLNWLPQFIFFMDDVQLNDERGQWAIFDLAGPQSRSLLAGLLPDEAALPPEGQHRRVTLAGVEGVHLAAMGELVGEGVTLLVPRAAAETVRAALHDAGAVTMPQPLWESLRVAQGRPMADRELTEEYNPLEAGLWMAVSFRKGCYIGQEVVARLDTYQKLKQQLWGLDLEELVQPGTPVHVEGKAVGTVTSVAETPRGPRALAYVRSAAGGEGLTVEVDGTRATVVELPLLTRGRSDL